MDFFDDFDWLDLATAGSFAEEMADEEMERRELERELEEEEDPIEGWDKDF